jgi:hypothetical protein
MGEFLSILNDEPALLTSGIPSMSNPASSHQPPRKTHHGDFQDPTTRRIPSNHIRYLAGPDDPNAGVSTSSCSLLSAVAVSPSAQPFVIQLSPLTPFLSSSLHGRPKTITCFLNTVSVLRGG